MQMIIKKLWKITIIVKNVCQRSVDMEYWGKIWLDGIWFLLCGPHTPITCLDKYPPPSHPPWGPILENNAGRWYPGKYFDNKLPQLHAHFPVCTFLACEKSRKNKKKAERISFNILIKFTVKPHRHPDRYAQTPMDKYTYRQPHLCNASCLWHE